jgi:hypothetical protein
LFVAYKHTRAHQNLRFGKSYHVFYLLAFLAGKAESRTQLPASSSSSNSRIHIPSPPQHCSIFYLPQRIINKKLTELHLPPCQASTSPTTRVMRHYMQEVSLSQRLRAPEPRLLDVYLMEVLWYVDLFLSFNRASFALELSCPCLIATGGLTDWNNMLILLSRLLQILELLVDL